MTETKNKDEAVRFGEGVWTSESIIWVVPTIGDKLQANEGRVSNVVKKSACLGNNKSWTEQW